VLAGSFLALGDGRLLEVAGSLGEDAPVERGVRLDEHGRLDQVDALEVRALARRDGPGNLP
jgi:hypothetical protein